MILTSTEPNIFRMLFSIKNKKFGYPKNWSSTWNIDTSGYHVLISCFQAGFHVFISCRRWVFGQPKVQKAYNIIDVWLLKVLMENIILKIWLRGFPLTSVLKYLFHLPFLTLQTCDYSRSRVCNEKKVLDVQEIASVLDLKSDNEKKVLDVLPN